MSSDGQGQESVVKNLGLSGQANLFLFPKQSSHLGSKALRSCTFSASADRRNHQPTHCKVPQEARVWKVNEPTLSIISVGVFMGEKLITCDKYSGAWTSRQAACEQKHFPSAVLLAMDSPNQCPRQKLASTHTKDTKPKRRPQTR